MKIEDREARANIDRKNRRCSRSGSMQTRHYRANAIVQAGRQRHVQIRGDSFAGDRPRKDRVRGELITGGGLVQELELLVRERQQGESSSRYERSAYVDGCAALDEFLQT